MYEFIQGRLESILPTQLVVETGGVGYLLTCSVNTSRRFRTAENARVWTHLVVREDQLSLFGFHSATEREYFRDLIAVSGVGPKVGVALLSCLEATEIPGIILTADTTSLTKAAGVGKKLAERIILELKGPYEKRYPNFSPDQPTLVKAAAPTSRLPREAAEACEALVALGYKPAAAELEISKLLPTDGTDLPGVEALLRSVLQKGR
jgi:holliday junction DNA helicase RuvA